MESHIEALLSVKVEHRKDIHLIGKHLRTSFEDGRQARDIPPFFHETVLNEDLSDIPGRQGDGQYCVIRLEEGSLDFDYIIAVESDAPGGIPDGMVQVDIPAQDYAVMNFIKKGNPEGLAAFQFIEHTWLPQSGYRSSGGLSFVYYRQPFFDVYLKYGYDGNPVATVCFAIENEEIPA